MKILFVYKGRYQIRDAITIEYLSAIAKKYGHSTDLVYDQDVFGVTDHIVCNPFLNRIFSDDDRIVRAIIEKRPEIAVFLDGFARGRWNREISEKVKAIKSPITTASLFYWDPGSAAKTYDYVLIGEPELAFEKFIAEEIFKRDRGVYKFTDLADLDELPLPDKELFAPYINFKDSYLIYTSKGCPGQCSYCEETVCRNKLGSGYFRRKSPDRIILELEKAKERFNIREVIYKDSVFALNKDWLKNYLGKYKTRINVPYKCFGKVGIFDDEIASMLKESGCYCIEFGVQTFNERIKRDILKRNESMDMLIKAFSICNEHGLMYDVDHLFGIPREGIKDHIEGAKIYKDLSRINRIKCHNLTFYRQAEIYEYAPQAVIGNKDYAADFFSSISGEKDMVTINRAFQKYYKVLPILPERINLLLLRGDNWKIFNYVPYIFIVFLMSLLAIKKRDRRFKIYCKYYPMKVRQALLSRLKP